MVGKPPSPSTFGSFGTAGLGRRSSIGEMWIGAKQAAISRHKRAQIRASSHGFVRPPGMRICGSSVDDVWVQLYESNQPSKYYNKILYI
jgi:hypothetical protein